MPRNETILGWREKSKRIVMHIIETKRWAIKKNRKQYHAKELSETSLGGKQKNKAIVIHNNKIKGMSK